MCLDNDGRSIKVHAHEHPRPCACTFVSLILDALQCACANNVKVMDWALEALG